MSCNKTTYETHVEAKKVINYFEAVGKRSRQIVGRLRKKKPKRVYKCPDCGGYHLTSMKKK